MTVYGKPLSEYLAFIKPFVIAIVVVWGARLSLSLAGVPNTTARWLSVSAVVWFGVFYYAIKVHNSRFGGYKQLLVICALMNLTAQVLITASIVLAILTGTDNIYSAPEYSFGTGATWGHVAAHAFVGTTIGSLIPWLVGSGIMLARKKLAGGTEAARA